MYIDLSLIAFNLLPTNYQEPFKKGAFDEKEALINSCLLDLCKDYYCTFYWICVKIIIVPFTGFIVFYIKSIVKEHRCTTWDIWYHKIS